MREYIIAGDTDRYEECLIYICGSSRENAEKILNRMLTNPNDNDKFVMQGHRNLRVIEIEGRDTWWNDPFMRD